VRGLSALCLLGIVNAFYWGIKNQWMFEPTRRGGHWWLADAGVGLACFILGSVFWNVARIRSQNRLAAASYRYGRGEIAHHEFSRIASEHQREFDQ
jgi:hypothetical protein